MHSMLMIDRMAKDTSEDPNSVKAKIEWPSAPSNLSMQAVRSCMGLELPLLC